MVCVIGVGERNEFGQGNSSFSDSLGRLPRHISPRCARRVNRAKGWLRGGGNVPGNSNDFAETIDVDVLVLVDLGKELVDVSVHGA
jgi:hypothetical protein